MNLRATFRQILFEEEGQALTEYGLVVGVVAVAAIAGLTAFKTNIDELLTRIGGKLDAQVP